MCAGLKLRESARVSHKTTERFYETRLEGAMLLGLLDGWASVRLHLPETVEKCPICGKEACGHLNEPKP